MLKGIFPLVAAMERTPDDTTLVVFRRRMGPERFERLFARVVEQARQHGLLEGTCKLVDATVIRADAALRNRAELLREGRRRLVKALSRQDPERAARVAPLAEATPREGQPYRAVLAEEEARTATLLRDLADVSDPALVRGCEELLKVYTGEGGVAGFTDPDARWGFKKKDEPFLGYKAHSSCDASGLVTAVQTLPGTAAAAASRTSPPWTPFRDSAFYQIYCTAHSVRTSSTRSRPSRSGSSVDS